MNGDGEDDYIIKKDFMIKRSVMKSQIFQYDNFKARWFLLSKVYLTYYDGSLEKGIKTEKGRIPLSNITVVEEADLTAIDESKKCGFQVWYEESSVIPKKYHKLYVCATSTQMMGDWITEIRAACQFHRVDFNAKYHPGVWTPKRDEFTCCGQKSKDAPGCSESTTSSARAHTMKSLQPPKPKSPGTGRQTLTASPKLIRKSDQVAQSRPSDGPKKLLDLPLPEPNNRSSSSSLPSPSLQKKYVLVCFDYVGENLDDLSICKGEKLEIIDDKTEPFWWQARNAAGRIGFIPFNYVTEIKSTAVESYPWFFSDMDRPQAERLLKEDGREGVYLVRRSNQANCYTVGIFTKESRPDCGIVRHYHIKTNERGEYYLSDVHAKPSIPEVIGYHSQNAGGLVTRLRFYLHEKPAPPTVGLTHGKFKIESNELEFEKRLGKGNFGEVWKAKYKGKKDVAVKMTLPNLVDDYEFVNEAKLMMQLQNDHLVQLYGVCEKPNLLIVTEYMEEGALLDYLKKNKSRLLTQTTSCLDIVKQVCEGMAYLEEMKLIHRDLAARNCLVGSSDYGYIVKVADFGLSRCVSDDQYTCSVGARFPIRWASPEVLLLTKFSSKSDVWAFGVLMYEVFTCGDVPYHNLPRNQDVVEYVSKKRRCLPCPRNCSPSIYNNIMVKCMQYKEEMRPKFSELRNLLSLDWSQS